MNLGRAHIDSLYSLKPTKNCLQTSKVLGLYSGFCDISYSSFHIQILYTKPFSIITEKRQSTN